MANNKNLSFFWLEENLISGFSIPTTEDDLEYLYNKGIRHVISAQSPNDIKELILKSKYELNHFSIPIRDFSIPSEEQVIEYVIYIQKCIEQNEPIVVHCYAGCGRTGVLLMVYLLVFKDFKYEKALIKLRKVRSCAVETQIQESFLINLDLIRFKQFIRE